MAEAKQSDTAPAEILLVDDDAAVRHLLERALGAEGHRVRQAEGGEEALRAIAAHVPDLVICDLHMPGIDGLEVCRRLKSDEATRHLPFVLVTGTTDRDSRLRGLEAGADDYLTKPVDLGELFARTRSLLRAKRLDDEVRRQRQVLESLLAISSFTPGYAAQPDRLFADFLQRTAELLRAAQVAIVLERREQTPEIVACWPPEAGGAVAAKIASTGAMGLLLARAEPLHVGPADAALQASLGLAETFAGVPIHALDGHVIGAVAAFGVPDDLRPESLHVLRTLAQRTGAEVQLRHHAEHLEELVSERTRDLREALVALSEAKEAVERAHEATIFRLALAAEYRDNETANHLLRMASFTEILARAAGLPDAEVALLRHASLMHDIGKIGIPDNILQKPGPLTAAEYDLMKSHTVMGARIFEGSDAPLHRLSADVALGHHEWWNGQGYPLGRRGEEIPLPARIVAVADVFDALTSHRRYKPAWDIAEAFGHIEALAGTHLDPALVKTFLRERKAVADVCELLRDAPEKQPPAEERLPHALK